METETLLPLTRLNHVCDLIRAHAEDHEIRQTLDELLTIFDDCPGPVASYREKIAAAIEWVDAFSDPAQCARDGRDPVEVRSFAFQDIHNAISLCKADIVGGVVPPPKPVGSPEARVPGAATPLYRPAAASAWAGSLGAHDGRAERHA
jgi:hypothetical protein